MKRGAWAWSKNSEPAKTALYLSLWLIGLPFCLIVLYLIFRPTDERQATRIQTVARWVEPLSGAQFDATGFAALSTQHPNFTRAQWSDTVLPEMVALEPVTDASKGASMARLWLRMKYIPPADSLPGERLAIHVTRIMAGPWAVWVNGRFIEANLDDWRMQWNTPLFVKLPLDATLPGQPVDIELAIPYRLSQGYAVGSTYVGPVAAIQRLNDTRLFWQSSLPKAAILVTLVLWLIALQFWLARRSETGYLLLAITSVVWFIGNMQYFGDFNDETTSLWFGALNDAAISWVVPLLVMFSFQFETQKWPRLELFLVLYATLITILTLPIWKWEVNGLVMQHYGDLAVGIFAYSLLTWIAIRRGSHELRVVVLANWSTMILGLYDIFFLTSQRLPDGIHLFPFSTFFVFGAFLYVMQRRYVGALQTLEDVNHSLDQRVREREAELEQQHRKLLAIEQQRVLANERQRLMRDMHDGIGTAMMSSLTMAEQGRLTQENAASVLRDSLDELKLVIDSLEPVEHDLVALLANFRHRFSPRIEEAGVRIIWAMDKLPPLTWLDPSKALQVLRIVQESLTNVLKHSRANEVEVSAQLDRSNAEQPAAVVIRITDNGIGFDLGTAIHGRGLKNLRHRSSQLGGRLEIRSQPGHSSSVELRLPVMVTLAPLA